MNQLLLNFEVIDDVMAMVYRQKSSAERIMIGSRLWSSARMVIQGAIQTAHPNWPADRVNQEMARRMGHGVEVDEPL